MTTDAGIAAFLLKGTRLILVPQERLAMALAEVVNIKLLELPIDEWNFLTETMVWTTRTDRDPGHRWLRRQLSELAATMPPIRPRS
ncbi:hypothetical protein [Nocardia harenae]|uniref:hypothetical protein n=1 Tax=Nocardia harenae TaxID=358707 RepID=UPI000831201D|nr:hypothetical protein [Nocardia harenae]